MSSPFIICLKHRFILWENMSLFLTNFIRVWIQTLKTTLFVYFIKILIKNKSLNNLFKYSIESSLHRICIWPNHYSLDSITDHRIFDAQNLFSSALGIFFSSRCSNFTIHKIWKFAKGLKKEFKWLQKYRSLSKITSNVNRMKD